MASRWDRVTVVMLGISAALGIVAFSRIVNGDTGASDVMRPQADGNALSPFEADLAHRRIDGGDAYRLRKTGQLLGAEDADVSIIVFSNFGCGYCAKYHRVLKEVLQKYPDHVNVRYRNYIPTMDRGMLKVHLAAECAADQGRYSAFAEHVFENPAFLTARYGWRDIAEAVEVPDMSRFVSCTEAKVHVGTIEADNDDAQRLGVSGTPTSFVNGVRVIGAAGIGSLDSLIAYHLDRLH